MESFEAKPPDLAALRWVRWELLLCVPIGVLRWRQSVVEGPSSFQFPVVASPGKVVSRHVPYVSVLDLSLLLLPVAPTCQADSSSPPATKMWRLFVVTLDVTSSRFRYRDMTS
jgi:hypothetical protein